MYPDFIGIGAQKAGTTWLARNLQAHPQIYMPRKEVHYFDRKIHDKRTGLGRFLGRSSADAQWRRQARHWTVLHTFRRPSLQNLLWDLKYYMMPYNDRWYASVFEESGAKVAGEITPAYSILDSDKIAHVHDIMPNTKIIFMMRNPIERAWSQAVMSFDKAKGSTEQIGKAKFLRKLSRNSFQKLTSYLKTLENWEEYFPQDRFFVGFLEDVRFSPEELLSSLYGFLGVDPYFDPSLTGKIIHTRSTGQMPTKVAVRLAQDYHQEIAQLAESFGGHTSFWLHCANRLIEAPPEQEHIPYPLWESALWDEWKNSEQGTREVGLRSGPLSSLQATR
jgi:hypothetical protein